MYTDEDRVGQKTFNVPQLEQLPVRVARPSVGSLDGTLADYNACADGKVTR